MNEITIMPGKHKAADNFEKNRAFTAAFGTAVAVLISDYCGVETGTVKTRE